MKHSKGAHRNESTDKHDSLPTSVGSSASVIKPTNSSGKPWETPPFWSALIAALLLLTNWAQIHYLLTPQVESARASVEISRKTLIIAQRAYLSIGVVEQIPSGLKIHIANFGHVSAKITGGQLTYQRATFPGNAGKERHLANIPVGSFIAPGAASEFALIVDLPVLRSQELSEVAIGKQIAVVYGNISFDTGFGETDSVLVNVTFDPSSSKWAHVNAGVEVDLRRDTGNGK